MSIPRIHDLAFDDENEEKLAKRGIFPEDVLDVLGRRHLVLRNKRRGRGAYKIVGRDRSGRILTIILERTSARATWRPVTGWPSTSGEARQLKD